MSFASWLRSEFSAARVDGFVTLNGSTTASSCQPPWKLPSTEVKAELHTHRGDSSLVLNIKMFFSTRGAAGLRDQEERGRGEHAVSSWASESTHPLYCMSAGLHRTRECPRLLELCAAGQISWSQVSKMSPLHLTMLHCSFTSINYICIYTHNYCVSLFFLRTSRFASFPEYLILQIKKFTFGVDWVPKKLGKAYYPHRFILTVVLCTTLNAQQRASADFTLPTMRCNCHWRVCFVQQMTNKTKIGNFNSLFVLSGSEYPVILKQAS